MTGGGKVLIWLNPEFSLGMKQMIYIFSNGELHRKQNTLYFEDEEGKKKYVPVENTGEMMVFGEGKRNEAESSFVTIGDEGHNHSFQRRQQAAPLKQGFRRGKT